MTDDALDREVLEAEEARCKATREGDLQALKGILHEDYAHVTGGASVMSRQQYLDWVSATPRRHERHGLRVMRYGDTAVIIGGLTNHLSEAGGGTRVIEATVSRRSPRRRVALRGVSDHVQEVAARALQERYAAREDQREPA